MKTRMTSNRGRGGAFALLLALALGVAGPDVAKPGQAAEFTLKFGISSAEDAEHNIARMIKDGVEAKSKGRIEVQIYPRGQLGSQSATIQGIQTGTVEGFMTPADFYAGIDPRMGVLSFPFLFKDRAHANRTLSEPAIAQKLAALLESKGIIGCGQVATADVRYMTRNPNRRFRGQEAAHQRHRRREGALPEGWGDVHPDESGRYADGAAEQDDRWLG